MEGTKFKHQLSMEVLVDRIHTINQFWKSHREPDSPTQDIHGKYFRHKKLEYQLELLRRAHPKVYLQLDPEIKTEETYSIHLKDKIGFHSDGAHIPKRFADKYLTKEELQKLVRNYSNA